MKRVLKILSKILLGLFILLVLFSFSMYIITMGDYSVAKTIEYDNSIPHIRINKTVFHAETFGSDSNRVVIVIHGGPGNDYRYLLPLKPLSDKYKLVFYDQRGTGLSPRVDESEHSLENSLQDLSNIIDYYSPNKKVNIIGHSWGAMLASGYLAMHPERVNKIVLAEPGMLTTEQAKAYMNKFKIEFSFNLLKEALVAFFESLHLDDVHDQDRIDYIIGKVATLDIEGNPMRNYFCDKKLQNGFLSLWRYSGVAGQAIIEKGMDENGDVQIDLVTGVEKFQGKVLFITGECNTIIGEEFQKEHIKYFLNAEMIVIKDAGHTMLGEKPDESISIIRKYFEEIN